MDDEIFERIMQGAEEALAYAKGADVPGAKAHRVRVNEVAVVTQTRNVLQQPRPTDDAPFSGRPKTRRRPP